MELTDLQVGQANDLVGKFVKACPVCGGTDLKGNKHAISLHSSPSGASGHVNSRSAYMLRCAQCTHIMLFDLGDLGIV